MRNKNVIYMTPKPPATDVRKSLGEKVFIQDDGITILTRKALSTLTDAEFEIMCLLPFAFRVDEDTLTYIKERALQLGIPYAADNKNKSINTFNGKEKHP